MRNFFITGITGFVGSHMADYILQQSADNYVYGFKRWRSDEKNIQHLLEHPRVKLLNGDLGDSTSVKRAVAIAKPDVVYHFAAQSLPETSFYTPVHTLQTNIIGTTTLLDCICKDDDIDPIIVSVSSSEVYGNPTPDELPIVESNPIRAANPYSISKVGQDLMSQYYHKAFGLKIIITRMFSHEGTRRGKLFALSSFANQIATYENHKEFPNNGPYQIRVGNLKSVRTYNHIDDAVRAYWLCVEKGTVGEVYVIGGNETCEVGDALKTLIELSTHPDVFEVVVDPEKVRPTDITLQIPDCSKFKNDTGWTTTKGVKEICEDILNYWRDEV
tara:strand:- start:487 stop:1476 length:990 start_codon:yes stop_codon:yes gene_type:complete